MELINEMKMSRFFEQQKYRGFGIITAFRGSEKQIINDEEVEVKLTYAMNRLRNIKLIEDLRARGFDTSIRLKGVFKENYGTPEEQEVKEETFVIFSIGGVNIPDPDQYLKKMLFKLGVKYKQDSILFKPKTDKNAYLIGTSETNDYPPLGEEIKLGEFHPNAIGQFYSRMRGMPFVFGSVWDIKSLRDKQVDHQDEITGVSVLESLELVAVKTIDRKGEVSLGKFIKEEENIFQKTLDVLRG